MTTLDFGPVVIDRHYTPQDAATQPYPLLPLTVPPGTRGLTVTQEVTPDSATVDLGLADAAGVRGWSGGARRAFTVTPTDATPGYQPGALRAGIAVLLGLYHIPPEGADVRVTVHFHPEGSLRWYRGDLHAHTWHSDAHGRPATLAAAARDRGLDFVAVADHNTVTHHAHLHDPILLPAQEVTTYRGHFVAHGRAPLLEFRLTTPAQVQEVLRRAAKDRLLTVLAHPSPTCPSCDWAWGFEDQFDAFEVWNGPWLTLNWIAREKWLTLLDRGHRVPPVGGSDRHQAAGWPDPTPPELQVGSPTTWIRAASAYGGDLYAGILAGRTCVSEQPAGPLIDLSSHGGQLHYDVSGPPGGTFTVYAGRDVLFECPFEGPLRGEVPVRAAAYHRAEVTIPTPPEHVALARGRWPDHVTDAGAARSVRALSGVVWP
ncbi:CehA/McbA family metallohydrolase [Deinococcus sp. KSM4-11]|uniref:CehA/McbA family metallohydrolase n=1 Tax=Deinococcus sp. KSM4-11 TaxID=2568654 RepID=UPI001454DC1E|nr:CehA/McbA family metallohydrolase [Deinococcus sp. KSM4-11]